MYPRVILYLHASAVATQAALDPARGSCCAAVVVACEQYPWGMPPFHRPVLLSLTSCVLSPVLERADKQAGGHKLGVNGLAVDRDQSIL